MSSCVDSEGGRLVLEAAGLSADRLPLCGIEHLLNARSLRGVLADAVHQVFPDGHGGVGRSVSATRSGVRSLSLGRSWRERERGGRGGWWGEGGRKGRGRSRKTSPVPSLPGLLSHHSPQICLSSHSLSSLLLLLSPTWPLHCSFSLCLSSHSLFSSSSSLSHLASSLLILSPHHTFSALSYPPPLFSLHGSPSGGESGR